MHECGGHGWMWALQRHRFRRLHRRCLHCLRRVQRLQRSASIAWLRGDQQKETAWVPHPRRRCLRARRCRRYGHACYASAEMAWLVPRACLSLCPSPWSCPWVCAGCPLRYQHRRHPELHRDAVVYARAVCRQRCQRRHFRRHPHPRCQLLPQVLPRQRRQQRLGAYACDGQGVPSKQRVHCPLRRPLHRQRRRRKQPDHVCGGRVSDVWLVLVQVLVQVLVLRRPQARTRLVLTCAHAQVASTCASCGQALALL